MEDFINRNSIKEIKKDRGFLHEMRNKLRINAPHMCELDTMMTDWINELKQLEREKRIK